MAYSPNRDIQRVARLLQFVLKLVTQFSYYMSFLDIFDGWMVLH